MFIVGTNTSAVKNLEYKSVDIATTADIYTGTATSNTSTTMTDSTATWEVDEWADKVVKLTSTTDADDYCLILSNTSDTLTFDCENDVFTVETYNVLETYYADKPQSIYAFDIRNAYGAIVMPSAIDRIERSRYKIYNEMANNVDYKAVVMFRGADRARGSKYFTLDHKHEGADLYVHYFGTPHYDILNIEEVKRYASVMVNTDLSIASTTYAPILTFASINNLDAKRFKAKDRSGIYWLKFKSIIATKMLLQGSLSIEKEGGGVPSVVEISVRLNRDGTIIDLTDSATVVRLPVNDIKAVPLLIYLDLQKDDELTIIAKRDSGAISLLTGSTFTLLEL